jgi:hypothetical protein
MKLFKKLILALLLVAFTTTTALGFTDLHTNWHKDIVPWGVEQNIAKGFPDGTFKPDNAVTEAQFLALLLRKYDKTLTDNVNKSEWYNPYYVVAKNNNYPVSETPDSVILRTKVAEILAGTQGVNLAGDEAIAFLLARGLAKGKKKDEVSIENYYGQEGLTRAEALQFIRNLVEAGVEEIKERPFTPSNPADVLDDPIEKAKFDDLLNPVVVERPKAELDRQGWLSDEQSKYFRAELEKTIVMDKKNNTFSFYLPVLPEGFEWDIGFNVHYGPNVEDRSYILHEGNRLLDGKTYTFNDIRYSELYKGYFSFGPAKIGLLRDDCTLLNLVTGKYEYDERKW